MKHICLLFIILLYGCTQPTNKEVVIKDIHFEVTETSSFIGLPIQMVLHDSTLFINDFYGDSLIHCLSAKDGKRITQLGTKGTGPNDVLPPLYLFTRKDSLFLFSRPLWKLYGLDLTTGKVHQKFTVPSEVSLLFPLEEDLYFSSGMFNDKRFWIFNDTGNKIAALGDYPTHWKKEENIPLEARRMFHQVRGYGYARSKGVAVTSSHVLELYGRNGKGEYTLNKEILLADYEYNFTNQGISSQADLKPSFMEGAKDLAVTDDYVYVLFDVNTKDSNQHLNKEIWKYDWNGNLLCKYHPDVDLSFLTLSDHREIIALTSEEEAKIGIYRE